MINLSEDVSTVPSLLLSEAASKVDIVPLEVTDESLLGEIYHLQITENDIWVHHYKDKCICRFSRSGKFLNKVGKIGQGPGEFIQLSDFFIDEKHREIYIVSASRGIFVYDFDGNFKRQPTRTIVETMFGSIFNQFMIYNNHFFILQNLPLYREIPKDSLWSLALVDSSYKKKKIFKNPVVLYCGRLDRNKAPERLLRAFGESNLLQNSYHLVYIGTDTDHLWDGLDTIAARMGITVNVHYLGVRKNPYKYMRMAKVLVSCSFSEGLPGVLIESLFLNTPVISTNSSEGVWEILNCVEKYNPRLKGYYIAEDGIITSNTGDSEIDVFNLKWALEYIDLLKYENLPFRFAHNVLPENVVQKFII